MRPGPSDSALFRSPFGVRACLRLPIWNPYNASDTGQDFRIPATANCNDGSGNCWRIPANLIDPVGQKVVNVSPDPNTSSPTFDNNFVSSPIDRNRTNQFDIRVDHTISTKLRAFGRYSYAKTNFFRPAPRPGLSEGSFNDTFGTADLKSQAIAAGLTWILSPSMVSDTRFGYAMGDFFQLPPNFGSGCPQELIGLKNAPTDASICGGIPVFNFPGGTLQRIGRTTSVPQFQTPRSLNIRQSLSSSHGAHSLKFGGELLHVETGIRDISSLLGNFNFTGRFTGVNGRWENALADLLLGFPTRYQQDSNTTFNIYQRMYFGFVQDDWKITRKLTLNLGMRYEFATPPRERDLKWANFDSSTGKFISAKDGSLQDQALIKPDKNNFAPRFGFAYSLTPKTVLRGAYGIFYNHANRLGREGLVGIQSAVHHPGRFEHLRQRSAALAQMRSSGCRTEYRRASSISPVSTWRPWRERRRIPISDRRTFSSTTSASSAKCCKDLVFDVSYMGNRGLKLPSFRNLNPNHLFL